MTNFMEELEKDYAGKYYRIHDFMVDELGLCGGELLVYGMIYSFTEANRDYHGSIAHMAKSTGQSVRSVAYILKSLLEKELITKEKQNGSCSSVYKADLDRVTKCHRRKADKIAQADCKNVQNDLQNFPKSPAKVADNNKEDNKFNNTDYNRARSGFKRFGGKNKPQRNATNGFPCKPEEVGDYVEKMFQMALERTYAEMDDEESLPEDGKA